MTSLFKKLSALFAPAADKGGGGGDAATCSGENRWSDRVWARYKEAKDLLKRKEYAAGEGILKDLIKEGHPGAKFYLGRLCYTGKINSDDPERLAREGLALILDAGKTGYPGAFEYVLKKGCKCLAVVDRQVGIHEMTDSLARAVNLFSQLAEAGYPQGSLQLAKMYQKGLGVRCDENEARRLINQGVQQYTSFWREYNKKRCVHSRWAFNDKGYQALIKETRGSPAREATPS